MVDDQRIKGILEWEKSKTTKGLRSFLGLASYYRKFVQDFAKIAKPLSDLLKKSVSEIWDEHCYRAFGELKRRLTSAPVLNSRSGFLSSRNSRNSRSRSKCTLMRRILR